MPASESTFYNMKRLHLVFAVSSLALLGATVWMLAADHWRQWKVYQRTFRDRVEPWLTEARLREAQSEEFRAREEVLSDALSEARAAVPDRDPVRRFCRELEREVARDGTGRAEAADIEADYEALVAQPSPQARRKLLARLSRHVAAAETRRDNVDRHLRSRRADFNEARSFFEAAVGEGLSQKDLDALQERVDRTRQGVEVLTARSEEVGAHCQVLTGILGEITRQEDLAQHALDEHRALVDRYDRVLTEQRWNIGKQILRLPLIEAFGRPLAIDQVWLPELTIDYNFRRVARFDRCATCHQGIDKTAPASPSEPACLGEEVFAVELAVPTGSGHEEDEEEREEEAGKSTSEPTSKALYGFELAPQGVLDPEEATIGLVRPRTPAADADLRAGDVLQKINGVEITGRDDARRYLLEAAQALKLEIRRGLPHPYSSHPRMDLYVGSLSPHPVSEFGCTICHEGQGSATAFKFASHTPNDPVERGRWREQYGWFWNHDWDFPMRPRRFVEASCLKCHHAVTDLAPSRRFPDPPAPKLLAGYDLVRRSGCFGCHEIRGVTSLGEPLGPDMRPEPNDRQATKDPTPGTMRKVGPSLRDVAGKLDPVFLDDWLRNPRDLRPDTRMPQFYGLHEHLDGKGLADARRFEAVEIYAATEYLLARSQPVGPVQPPPEMSEPPSAEQGKQLFLTQGCLACHKHDDFPEAQSVQGPNLSNLASKLNTEVGRKWLVRWIRDPARHSPRTLMPNTLLEPVPLTGQGENGDPAADIAAYLLRSPAPGGEPKSRRALVESDLDELLLLHLAPAVSKKRAREYLDGTVELTAEEAEGDAAELLGRVTLQKKIRYVGRRTIGKRGCYGCHDIPGFEDAQPIGPALSDWGRKQESLLAFGQIHQVLARSSGEDADRDFYVEALLAHRREGFIWQKLRAPRSFDYKKAENKGYNERLTMGRFSFTPDEREAIITFVLGLVADPPAEKYVYQGDRRRQAIAEGRKVLDKYGCAECHTLEMERWQVEYDPDRIEAPYEAEDYEFLRPGIDPPALEASTKPDRRGLLHTEAVGMAQRDETGETLEDADDNDHPMYYFNLWEPLPLKVQDEWMAQTVGGPQLGVSDPYGVVTRSLGATGVWAVPGEHGQDARATRGQDARAAHPSTVEEQRLRPTYTPYLTGIRPAVGGAFARMLFPHVLDEDSPAVMEAWGWLPPSLVGEGFKVRPAWLHDYLLEPLPIRPAVVLRMPKYTMSPEEAGKLVDYFAAVAGVEFPYTSDPRGRSADLEAKELARPNRLDDAMRIVIDRTTYCTKCHLVGDYSPGGESRTVLAPRLDRAGRRLRPEYLHRWLANPKSILPYTGMPVNFPPAGPPMGQNRFEGTSIEQLDAVMDLLINYDGYMNGRSSIRAMIESAEKAGSAAEPNGR